MAKKSPSLRILVPEATTNYILNPSARFDTTGYNASSSTISRTLDYARFGIASLKVITTGAVLREGVYYRVSALAGINDPITVSAYVRGGGKVRIRLIDNPAGAQWVSKAISLSATRWQRIEVTGRCTGRNDMRLYVETDGAAAQLTTFYVDGAQMERKAYSTTYCDGDQPGCRWNIIQHASISTRDPYTREGGKWVELSGAEREEENLYMTVVGGLGMAPIQNHIQSFATAPGSYFQNSKINERIVTLTFHAKHADLLGRERALTLDFLHALRQLLIDVVKPDLTGGDQDFLMEYKDGDIPLYFRARYDGGLEGEWDVRNKWINSFPLRLLLVSPMIYEDSQEMATIDFQEMAIYRNVAGRENGVWSPLGAPFGLATDANNQLAIGKKGEIYIVGKTSSGIRYWDGTAWNELGAGIAGVNSPRAVTVAPNGNIYVTGDFTAIGGVAANRVAFWDGTTWNAMGTGLNNTGRTIAIAPNGDVYVGGDFTTAGGITVNRIAKWDGISWNSMGALKGFNQIVNSIVISPDGLSLYVGGAFTDQFGLAASALLRVAKYTVSTNLFSAVGSGFNGAVSCVFLSLSGTLYAGGAFTASGSGTSMPYVAQLIGSVWAPMGIGMDFTVRSIAQTPNGDIIAVGYFETAGGIPCKGIALWNGSTWVNMDIVVSVNTGFKTFGTEAIVIAPNGDIYIVPQTATNVQTLTAGITLVDNTGTAEASPFLYILNSGRLKWLENQTTRKRILFDLVVLAGEEIFLDFGKGTIKSTVRGDLYYSIVPGSDFNAFTLVPGVNKIACLMSNDTGAVVKMGYVPTHWSIDSSV